MSPARSHQLAEQYGPVFTVHLGHQKTVVLTGYEAVKKALVGAGQELAGRPPIAIFQLINGGGGRCVRGAGCSRGCGMMSAPMRPRGSTTVPAWQAQSNGGGAHQDWACHASWRGRWGLGGPEAPSGSCPGPLSTGRVRPAGVFFSSGPRWRAARQLTVRALHGLGVGRAPVANKVLQELRCLMVKLDSYRGERGPGRLCPAQPTALKPLSPYRPALPAGPAPLGSLQHHLHTPLRPAVRLPGPCVRVPARPR